MALPEPLLSTKSQPTSFSAQNKKGDFPSVARDHPRANITLPLPGNTLNISRMASLFSKQTLSFFTRLIIIKAPDRKITSVVLLTVFRDSKEVT